ncbi:rRNA maturation RNase YbeY [Chitinophagales bacterium]|nr:rRNA maturation RNase YbeY [Chitinophagales bacterium]
MAFDFIQEHPDFKFTLQEKFTQKAEQLLNKEGFNKTLLLTVVFMTNEDLLTINKKHLNHDYFTDIITFPIEEDEECLEAEIYMSIDSIRDNAIEYKNHFNLELLRVFLHGILHLIGYGDKTTLEQEVMRSKETYYVYL